MSPYSISDYASAARYLGGKPERPMEYATRIRRRADGSIAIRHHQTDIIVYHPDRQTVTVTTGGWYSATTFRRIRRYALPVYTDRGQHWVHDHGRRLVPFHDGLTFVRTGPGAFRLA